MFVFHAKRWTAGRELVARAAARLWGRRAREVSRRLQKVGPPRHGELGALRP